jgi:hypothetical protein
VLVAETQGTAARPGQLEARLDAREGVEISAQGCSAAEGKVAGCGTSGAALGSRSRATIDGLEVIVPEVLYRSDRPLVTVSVPPVSALDVPFPAQGNSALW